MQGGILLLVWSCKRSYSLGEQPKPPHLIFLGELQPIICLQSVNVVSQICHWNGRMVTHACQTKQREEKSRENIIAQPKGQMLSHLCTIDQMAKCHTGKIHGI